MTTFRTLSRLTLGLIVSLGALWSSSYAVELDSTNITSAPFNCSTGATSCDLSYQNITSIASDTFVNHTNLTTLYLGGNQITSIESGDFSGLSSLTTLDLEFNQITSIESGDFAGISNLQTLNLVRNQITSIESGDFAGLSNLTTLNLGSIQITSIESGDFAGLSSLTTLNLGGNQITSIENGDFAGLSSLTTLYLFSNQISSIESGDFSGLTSLTSLGLYGNQITSIESGDFVGLSALTSLGLGGNRITSIESGDFAGLGALITLDLGYNQITSIESGDFDGLDALTNLGLGYNCINNEDSLVTSYLDTLPGIDYSSQFICLQTQYTPSTSTSGPVTGSLSFVGPASMVALLSGENPDMTLYDHVFTGNGSHLYDYSSMTDSNGFLWSRYMTNIEGIPRPDTITGSVTWILPPDTTPPLGTLSYSTTGITNQSVIATLTLSETGIVNNNSGSLSYVFSGNGAFNFQYQDIAGNTGTVTATVTWIDTTAPTIILNGSGTLSGYVGTSYTDAGASWTDAVAGSGTLIGSGIVDTSLTGTYIISYSVTDTAGNTSTTTRTVTILPVVVVPPVIVPPSGGGGSVGGGGGSVGGGSSPITPIPTVTKTPAIGPIHHTGIITTQTGIRTDLPSTPTPTTTIVQQKAYEWALSKGITTVATVQEARLDKNITRAELAKMLSVYATDVLEKEPVQGDITCDFTDTNQTNKDLLPYITQVCELGIMGVQSDGKTPLTKFNPNSLVTRAEFGTVLSRVLYGTTNNTSSPQWREGHLNNLRKSNIISVVNPNLQEQRGWIMTMLYRTVQ